MEWDNPLGKVIEDLKKTKIELDTKRGAIYIAYRLLEGIKVFEFGESIEGLFKENDSQK